MTRRTGDLRWPIWIGIVADDLERQTAFYRDVLGFPELDRGDDWVQLDAGDRRMVEVLARSGVPQYDRPRVQVGFEVTDIRAVAETLVAKGVDRITDIEGGPDSGQFWCYFRDAEGNVFEIAERITAT